MPLNIREVILHAKTTEDGRGLLAAARDMERAADSSDRLGKSFRGSSEDAKRLGEHIERTSAKVKDLRLQIARTGDTSLFRDLGAEESKLRRLKRLAEDITPGGGGKFALAIPNIGGVPGPLIAAGAGLTAALSPFLGGVVAATVLGGVGTGGLIGGIALASKDTRVRSAFKDLGHELFTDLGDAASPFVGPLVASAHKIGDAFRSTELPAFRKDFEVLAATVDPITGAITGFVHELHPGLSNAFKASVPIAKQFETEMSRAGGATSDFLDEMVASAPGARIALHDLFTVADEGLVQLGQGIHFLSETYEWTRKLGLVAPPEWLMQASKGLIPAVMDLAGGVKAYHRDLTGATPAAHGLNREIEDQAEASRKAAQAMEANTRAVDDYLDTIMGRQDATEAWHRALLDLTDSVKENGTSLSLMTREGLANRDALEEAARATREMHDAGLLTDFAYTQQMKSLEALAIQLKFNRDEVHALIGEMEKTPRQIIAEVLVRVNTAFTNLGRLGLGGMSAQTSQQGRGGTDFSLTPVVRSPDSRQFIEGTRDVGGPVGAGKSYLIGSGVQEVLTMGRSSGFVTPITGQSSPAVRVMYDSTRGGDAFLKWLREAIRIEAGTGPNSVQAALGQRG